MVSTESNPLSYFLSILNNLYLDLDKFEETNENGSKNSKKTFPKNKSTQSSKKSQTTQSLTQNQPAESELDKFRKHINNALKKSLQYYDYKYNISKNDFFITASFLDPTRKRFMAFEDKNDLIKRAKRFLVDYYNDLDIDEIDSAQPSVSAVSKSTFYTNCLKGDYSSIEIENGVFKNLASEIKDYDKNGDSKQNMLKFWQENSKKYKRLSHVASMILSAQASVLPCERLFSSSGYCIDDKRTRLAPIKFTKLMTIQQYERSIESKTSNKN
jgi:hypothetical protein